MIIKSYAYASFWSVLAGSIVTSVLFAQENVPTTVHQGFSFDWSISLGTVVNLVGAVTAVWVWSSKSRSWLDKRISRFETVLEEHARTLSAHASKMEKQDDILMRLVGDVQRLIGRLDVVRTSTIGRRSDDVNP